MSQQGQKQEYGDLMVVLLVVGIICFSILAEYFFYYYLYFWRGVCILLGSIVKYTPSFINEIIYFWTSIDVNNVAERVLDIVYTNNNSYFQNNEHIYDKINIYFNSLFRPYLFMLFLYTGYIIVMKKNFNKVFLSIKHKKNRLKTVDKTLNISSIDQLLKQESKIWPSVKLMINNHPEFISSLDEGVWAMAKRPEKYAVEFKLLDEITDEYDNKYTSLNEEKTFKIFNIQMGEPWTGFNKLKSHEIQLLAIVFPKILRKTDESREILDIVASSYSTENKSIFSFFKDKINNYKLNKSLTTTINKYKDKPEIKTLINRHFYKKTLFAALLEQARDDGIIASSEFLWLKLIDRPLWYMLNNVGRKSSFIECAAPWSHFMAEKVLDRKIANPMISNAMIAFDQYLYDTSYQYIKIYNQVSDLED